MEGLETMPIQYKKDTTNIIDGYYKIDASTMAAIPYGYIRDPIDETKIIPNTQTAIERNQPVEGIAPPNGEIMPDGYYLLDASNLAVLPPNMKPKLIGLDISGNPPTLKYTYDTGYIGETDYYKLEFPVASPGVGLGPGVYYVDEEKTKIALLFPDEMVDEKGWGKKRKTNAPDPEKTTWSKTRDNYDVEYHEPADVIMAREGTEGQCATVIDPSGMRLCIPRLDAQGQPLFYTPGSYKYGGANYIPKYEDSVYLSRTTQEPTVGAYEPSNKPHGFCFLKNVFPQMVETECAKLDKQVCASTECCVLIGGQKCVAGDATGPTSQSHYKDPALSITDHYYYRGRCYGNCPPDL